MLFQTTAAHEELRAKIRSFAEEEIKPLAFLMDQNNEFPEEAVKKLGKLGWMGIPYPKEYGGAGLDALSYAIAVEELGPCGRRQRAYPLRPRLPRLVANFRLRH
ncbi:protein containing Acyl-CoA dehydrogenase [human gut metagenome]|uniref:Protein containing Acyl-CoA dehydrogenase n=1 Tax=human gut metagenome TaxID=408170 RepID=K1U8B8_9ZZZZ